jgi:hypothetical protein
LGLLEGRSGLGDNENLFVRWMRGGWEYKGEGRGRVVSEVRWYEKLKLVIEEIRTMRGAGEIRSLERRKRKKVKWGM